MQNKATGHQCINCHVSSCAYNDRQACACTLSAIDVKPCMNCGDGRAESETNCAIMAADELRDYLENGNIHNSVNLPEVVMERSGLMRLCVIHKNVPAMLANITALLSRDGINVENLSNKSKGDLAYTMVDLGAPLEQRVVDEVRQLANVIRVRAIL